MIKHPSNRRERLQLKNKYEKKTRGVWGEDPDTQERLSDELREFSLRESESEREEPLA